MNKARMMSAVSALSPVSAAILIALAAASAAFADDLAEGQKLYQKGKFDEASAYFERAIDSNGYDAKAHYYLANCRMSQKDYTGAVTEYQRAMEFTEDSKMEDYCRRALEKLKPFTEPKPAASASQGKSSHPESHLSASVIEDRTNRVKSVLERSQKEAKDIIARAEERCRPILEEKRSVLETMSIRLKRRVETTSAEEREETTRDYDRQLESIRHLARQQADGVLEQGRKDAAAVGQGLPNLEELLQAK